MPTYSNPLSIVPTEYVPIDYRHDAQFEMAEAQQTASNIAVVKSRYEDLLGMDLTNNKSKESLSGFMKNAESELQKISGMNMLVYDNAKKATDIFTPLTDINGQYGYIVVDNAFTKKYNSNKSLASQAKAKGENYNITADKYLDIQRQRFVNSDDTNQWMYLLNDTSDYVPYYDNNKEMLDLVSKFKPDQFQVDSPDGKGTIITTKNDSVYASRLKDYLDANLSDNYKRQAELEAKVEFGNRQLASYNPQTKQYDSKKVFDYYDNQLNTIKQRQVNNYTVEKTNLERESALLGNSSENIKQQQEISVRIKNIDDVIKQVNNNKLDIKDFEDFNNYRKSEAIASSIYLMKDVVDKADADSHLDISVTQKKDDNYWAKLNYELELQKLKWDMDKESIRKGEKRINSITGELVDGNWLNPNTKTDMSQKQELSISDRGYDKLTKSIDKIKNPLGSGSVDFIDSKFKSLGFKNAVKDLEDPEKSSKLEGKTWGEVIESNLYGTLGMNESFNKYLLASAQKLYLAAGPLNSKTIEGSKIYATNIDKNGMTTILTAKGMYTLNKNNQLADQSGKIIDNDFNKVTMADLSKLPYKTVLHLAIEAAGSPKDREIFSEVLPTDEFTKADAELQLAKSSQTSLIQTAKSALKGTILENANVDLEKLTDKDYLKQKAKENITNYTNSLIGKPYNGGVIKRVFETSPGSGDWNVSIHYANNTFAKDGEAHLEDTPYYNEKYFKDQVNLADKEVAKFYENYDKVTSNSNVLEYEQRSAVPQVMLATAMAGDKDLKDQWNTYERTNQDIVRGSINPEKPIVNLVNQFPGAFVPIRDENGYRFELNANYVANGMTPEQQSLLYSTLNNVVGNGFWNFDKIDYAEEAVEQLNDYVQKHEPNFFNVDVKGYNGDQFKNEKTAQDLFNGAVLQINTIVPKEYNITLDPISLSVKNRAASSLQNAGLILTGDFIKPLYKDNGDITFDEKGNLKFVKGSINDITGGISQDQLAAQPKTIIVNLATKANAWSAIASSINLYSKSYKNLNITDLEKIAKEKGDTQLLNNLKIVSIIK